eukprot:288435_1
MLLYSLILAVISINTNVNGGPTCSSMEPMCTFDGLSFSAIHHNGSFAATGPFYKCLSTQPDPAWFYLEISTAGDIHMKLEAAHDIDFIIYGPYSDKASAQGKCGTLGNPSDEVTDCSFLPTQIESVDIFNATVGEVYVMLITNYAKVTQDISLVSLSMSTGATDCAIVPTKNPTTVTSAPTAGQQDQAPTTPPVPTHEPTPRPTEVSILVQLKDKADNGSMYVGIGIGIGITCVFCICFGLVLYFAAIKPKISSHQYVQANVVSDTGTENLNLI